ncbi:flavin monoamine oxidase family protein [Saccharothrix australiensis]|uniref:Secreted protein n=1 Tax=Saccharothrix australiensis TaxID=2072 RepID=A0A495VZX6_9PSEU|nr:flavin monoamine oxidase family protein [Saccharothrix australiensis]RKT54759.1 secreted protein [Saccharothrix australiensis]
MTALTRRRFLEAVGLAGGAGAMFHTMGALGLVPEADATPFVPPREGDLAAGRRGRRVLVLGAGIAGLATAYELGKAGYDCVVLEAGERAGGRVWTVRGGDRARDLDGHVQTANFAEGRYFNAGAARIAQSMITLDYCRELGIAIEPFAGQNANAHLYDEKVSDRPTTMRAVKADVFGHLSELLAKATDRGALDGELTGDDKERLLGFLEHFGDIGGEDDGFAYRGGSRRGYSVLPGAGTEEGKVLGPPEALSRVFSRGLDRVFDFELDFEYAMMMFQVVGGTDRIPSALASAVGARRIRYGCEVRSIRNREDGVEVDYREPGGAVRVERGDYCVAALPPHVLARLDHNLGPAVTAALATPVANPVGKLGLEYGRRWWEQDLRLYGGITRTDLDIHQIWFPSSGLHSDGGVVVGYYNIDSLTEPYDRMAPDDRLRRALDQGARIYGDVYRRDVRSSFSVAWSRVPHIGGGWVTWPSEDSPEYRLLTRPAGRVHFAGDWLSHWISWQDGAFLSARKAVTEIHRRVAAG